MNYTKNSRICSYMNKNESYRIFPAHIRALPKVELHRHLDCSLRWSTLARILNQKKPRKFLIPHDYLILDQMKDLKSVLEKFSLSQKALSSVEILETLAYECCIDAFNEGILLLELRFSLDYILNSHPNLSYENILLSLNSGIKKAESEVPMKVGLIGILQRTRSIKHNSQTMDFILDHKEFFVGVDLADQELGFDSRPFKSLFLNAKKAGLGITIHAGEVPHPSSIKGIQDAVQLLEADRIGHGVQCIQSPPLIKLLREKNVTLEICPYSNYLTQAFKNFKKHPIKSLFDAGLNVTINSDDPGIFMSTLIDDYLLAFNLFNFSMSDFKSLNKIAFKNSFISTNEKKNLSNLFMQR